MAERVGLDQTEAPQNSGRHMSMDLSEDSGQYPQYHVGNNIRITLQAKKSWTVISLLTLNRVFLS